MNNAPDTLSEIIVNGKVHETLPPRSRPTSKPRTAPTRVTAPKKSMRLVLVHQLLESSRECLN